MRLPANVVEPVPVSTLKSGDFLLTPKGLIWVRVMSDGTRAGINLSSDHHTLQPSKLHLDKDQTVLCVREENLEARCELLSLPVDAEGFRYDGTDALMPLAMSPAGWLAILQYRAGSGTLVGTLLATGEYGEMPKWGGEVIADWRIEFRIKDWSTWFARWSPARGIEFAS